MHPLDGVKILDLSNYVPGALCTMILADMGAEVIKIEPAAPFPMEDMGYSSKGEEKRRKAAFFTLNRNKKSMGLNLRTLEGREIFHRLARKADVVIEGYRPGVVQRLGVDYDTLRVMNPGLIYCSLSGYGQDGPYRLYSGHDINYISIAGVLGVIGPAEGPPSVPLNLIADFAGVSLYGAVGILLAYIARQKTGEGQYIDHTYMEGALHLLTWFTQDCLYNGTILKRGESWAAGTYPYYAVYKTKDGKYLSIGCLEPHFWDNLCRVVGREDFSSHPWSMDTTFRKPGGQHDKMFRVLKEIFLTKTRDEWFDLLAPKDVPVGKVYAMDEVFTDPQILARKMVVELEDPKLGKIRQVGILPKLSRTPGTIRSLPPLHGDHTDEILREAGYSEKEIGEYRGKGIVG
ncbi:MAG TPA: CaiB/BaiF CoA-transferase family protein [Syntrophales bacterium]|nr:CaiB/BaiF CoA-transferase family protein [Syntrophales bacterium]HQB29550.1 CaiB/BaiF CoA-transferase family protein [Syntrophales bacterium]HQN76663.1 CaiB/BaiF CoA-transferase family protein [Syntrophales bacterium]HQQ27758.1 CaiB/BaiF CoA-transferase family protein [Syntrophales bacterium]